MGSGGVVPAFFILDLLGRLAHVVQLARVFSLWFYVGRTPISNPDVSSLCQAGATIETGSHEHDLDSHASLGRRARR
jgi:hypothetical protein